MFPEALLLHYMDDLDSKMESMRAHLERRDSPNAWRDTTLRWEGIFSHGEVPG